MNRFPNVPADKRTAMLTPPTEGALRVLIDTDTANEIDDQFALAWALLSPDRLSIEAVVAEPYSFAHHRKPLLAAAAGEPTRQPAQAVDKYQGWVSALRSSGIDPEHLEFTTPDKGMEESYQEVLRVYEKLGLDPAGRVYRGSTEYLSSSEEPVESEGARRIVEAAMEDRNEPLYIVAIGAVTNIASALLMEPQIVSRIVVTWTSGFPSWFRMSNRDSLNLVQDPHASRLLFDSGAPIVYLPGYHVGAQLRLSLPEIEAWVRGRGEIGDYLHYLYLNNPIHLQRGIRPHPGQSWVIWDLINIAWLLDHTWVPTVSSPTPTLDDDLCWSHVEGAVEMLEAYGVDRDAIFEDLFLKLDAQDEILAAST